MRCLKLRSQTLTAIAVVYERQVLASGHDWFRSRSRRALPGHRRGVNGNGFAAHRPNQTYHPYQPLASTLMIAAGLHEAHTGNFILDYFIKGGPIMWPLLVTSIVAVAVILERIVWWVRQNHLRESTKVEKVFTAIENGQIREASSLARNSEDPRLRTIWHGLNHSHSTMQSALQVAAGLEIQRASRFLGVMDTIITLAPLLGLLGTVTGIMGAFQAVGQNGMDVDAVSSGIGEALIATACGLTIAMCTLIPYNFFTSKVERLKFELETASTNLEVMMQMLNREDKDEVTLSHTP
jgi:biopolymer transport protein ExbB